MNCLSRSVYIIALICFSVQAWGGMSENRVDVGDVSSAESMESIEVGEAGASKESSCLTEQDLDFEKCRVEDLPVSGLRAICERIGLDLEHHLQPLFEDNDKLSTPGSLDSWTHNHYVYAANECLRTEERLNQIMGGEAHLADLDERMANALTEGDYSFVTLLVADVLKQDPDLVHKLEKELKDEEPELYEELMSHLNGKPLMENPEILAELLSLVLAEDPKILDDLSAYDAEEEEL